MFNIHKKIILLTSIVVFSMAAENQNKDCGDQRPGGSFSDNPLFSLRNDINKIPYCFLEKTKDNAHLAGVISGVTAFTLGTLLKNFPKTRNGLFGILTYFALHDIVKRNDIDSKYEEIEEFKRNRFLKRNQFNDVYGKMLKDQLEENLLNDRAFSFCFDQYNYQKNIYLQILRIEEIKLKQITDYKKFLEVNKNRYEYNLYSDSLTDSLAEEIIIIKEIKKLENELNSLDVLIKKEEENQRAKQQKNDFALLNCENTINEQHKEISQQQKEYVEYKENLKKQLNNLEKNVGHYGEAALRYQEDLESYEEDIENKDKEISEQQKELNEKNTEISKQNAKIENLTKRNELKDKYKELKVNVEVLEKEKKAKEDEISNAKKDSGEKSDEVKKLQEELNKINSDIKTGKIECDAAENDYRKVAGLKNGWLGFGLGRDKTE